MPDRTCHSCSEPWDVDMEPDATIPDVADSLSREYGGDFKVEDVGGVAWAIINCPSCPDGAKPTEQGMAADMNDLL